jgi:transcriptional regulator with XRE-family HTH domain
MNRKDLIYGRVGGNIRFRRQQLLMNQNELAKKVELTRSSIVQIESGKQAITLHTLYSVAQALDISVHKLLPELNEENDFDSYSSNRVENKAGLLNLLDQKIKEVPS